MPSYTSRSALVALWTLSFLTAAAIQPSIGKIVAGICKADYQGDRVALERLDHETDGMLVGKPKQVSRILYWRGFAIWRRAVNGFNDGITAEARAKDLEAAIEEFEAALTKDPGFADAKIGAASCMMTLAYLDPSDRERAKALLPKFVRLLAECKKEAADNPRLYWVNGAGVWYVPQSQGGGEDVAIGGYIKGLELARNQKKPYDPLEPTWGEPELLMSLAWSNLNRQSPDLPAAERYAKQALKIVPYWHYVRDILLPQIQKARQGG
jgi:tetratricopeptide (TPR) repeat protein